MDLKAQHEINRKKKPEKSHEKKHEAGTPEDADEPKSSFKVTYQGQESFMRKSWRMTVLKA